MADARSDALVEGGQMVVYGAMSGKSAHFSWHQWIFQGIHVSAKPLAAQVPTPVGSPAATPPLQVKGFNVRRWMREQRKRLPAVLEALGKLVAAGKLQAACTEYELATEFGEALEHAMERGRNTKVVLKVSDIGVQY